MHSKKKVEICCNVRNHQPHNISHHLTISPHHHLTIPPPQHLNISPPHHHSMYFLNRRPRGFHHTFRFSSEQRDLLDNLRRGVPPEELAERSIREAEPPSRRRHNGQVRLLGLLVMIGFILLAIILLMAL
ncbi:hypothetical protein [Leyella stercorea]|uniref:hypothetical protein n=2 Tax=Leyella stercorea TaxID=363265 RepID=UPI002431E358|nr:hypothetical protein [Leyella stercorea]